MKTLFTIQPEAMHHRHRLKEAKNTLDNQRRAGIITLRDSTEPRRMPEETTETTPYTALLAKAKRAAIEAGYDPDVIEQICANSEPLHPLEIEPPEELYGGVIAGIKYADESYRRAQKPSRRPGTQELHRRSEFVSLKTVAETTSEAIEYLTTFHKITDVKLLEEVEEALWQRKALLEAVQARREGHSR